MILALMAIWTPYYEFMRSLSLFAFIICCLYLTEIVLSLLSFLHCCRTLCCGKKHIEGYVIINLQEAPIQTFWPQQQQQQQPTAPPMEQQQQPTAPPMETPLHI